jgi:hypothetical protein
MDTQQFDAPTAIDNIRRLKSIRRRQTFYTSRLKKYRAELIELRRAGASYREIALWLKHNKRLKITHTSVMRYLNKLPELKKANE